MFIGATYKKSENYYLLHSNKTRYKTENTGC